MLNTEKRDVGHVSLFGPTFTTESIMAGKLVHMYLLHESTNRQPEETSFLACPLRGALIRG
jgi:hypothetical protein